MLVTAGLLIAHLNHELLVLIKFAPNLKHNASMNLEFFLGSRGLLDVMRMAFCLRAFQEVALKQKP
jgi:hypothetical protein